MIVRPYSEVQKRPHSIVRLGLTPQQINDLYACAHTKAGQPLDIIELITFGTIRDPAREICTMMIMHCLDNIGFDRYSVGLGGFVSPNDIARTFGLPNGYAKLSGF